MNIAVIGLGLIGASMAKTIKDKSENKIFGYDLSTDVMEKAVHENIIDGILSENNLSECELVIICVYPKDTIEYVENNLYNFSKDTIIVDCSGVKTDICQSLSKLCRDNKLHFVGGHPMAGLEHSGYDYSVFNLFSGASMILCEDEYTSKKSLDFCKNFFSSLGFGKITVTNYASHDDVIAFTSQLAHVVSNAYIQSDQAKKQMGFSAGSYKDLTRVAYLNENMWSQLFIANKKPLIKEIRGLSKRLEIYADLIETENAEDLKELLKQGKEMKKHLG
ncbi:MAG: prephenate dehydrogenase [Clostridia bacterium]